MLLNRYAKRLICLTPLVSIAVFLYVLYTIRPLYTRRYATTIKSPRVGNPGLECSQLPGADDIVMLLKTGANEVEERIPTWRKTLFRCSKNNMIFSDVQQTFQGLEIEDPLGELFDKYLTEGDEDLNYYRSMQEAFAGGTVAYMHREPGWKLDRFKYMPMLKSAYDKYPKAKWFVFVETDTAVMWSNLVPWLNHMDPNMPIYAGSDVVGGKLPDNWHDVIFAHGGTGFIVSKAAASKLVRAINVDEKKYFDLAKNECCGDAALARMFHEVGVKINPSYPNTNGDTQYGNDYSLTWCYAPVFMHHIIPDDLQMLHDMEEDISQHKTITYADIFHALYSSKLESKRLLWDNFAHEHSFETGPESESYENCHKACLADSKCVQFTYRTGECKTDSSIRWGIPNEEARKDSGWILERVDKHYKKNLNCKPKWWIPTGL